MDRLTFAQTDTLRIKNVQDPSDQWTAGISILTIVFQILDILQTVGKEGFYAKDQYYRPLL